MHLSGVPAPSIIQEPMGVMKQRKMTIPGIIETTTFSPEARQMMSGIIQSPSIERGEHGKAVHKAKPTKTKYELGMAHIPGTKY